MRAHLAGLRSLASFTNAAIDFLCLFAFSIGQRANGAEESVVFSVIIEQNSTLSSITPSGKFDDWWCEGRLRSVADSR